MADKERYNANELGPKGFLKKVWYFIWEDDSIWSWLLNILLAFLIIKFLVYPGLGLVMGTNHPIVAVVSGSMEHDGNFEEWWMSNALCNNARCSQEQWYSMYDIDKTEFLTYKFKNGFNIGDIMFLKGKEPKDIKNGDVLVFDVNIGVPIIHRVIDVRDVNGKYYYTTKGDHNPGLFEQIGEANISEDQVIGVAVFKVPWLGYVKIWFMEILKFFNITN